MNINDVKKWLDTLELGFNRIVLGQLTDTSIEKLLSLRRGVSRSKSKGSGNSEITYDRIAINCIVHWNKNLADTDAKVKELEELFYQIEPLIKIGGFLLVELIVRNVVYLGLDSNDIYEYAFDIEIIYKKDKEVK